LTQKYKDKQIIYDALEKKLELSLIEELPLLIYNHSIDARKYESIIDVLIEDKATSLT